MTAVRIAALTLVHLVCFVVATGALLPASPSQPAPDPAASLGGLAVVRVATTLVVAYVLRHARWRGSKLAAALFVVLYGVTTLMPQIESAFFLTRLPAGMLPRLFLAGAIVSAIYAPLAVRLLGRWRGDDVAATSPNRLRLTANQWIVRLAIVVVAHLLLYFGFGYFVAWQSAAVREYYGGADPGSFAAQMKNVVRETPMLVPLQVLRAVMWAGLGTLVTRMTTGAWWTTALGVALLFSVVMNSQLLLPNPYMPRDVRLTHLVETASSNFIFGWVLVAVLLGRRGRTPRYVAPATAA